MSISNELAHLRKLLDMQKELNRNAAVNPFIYFGLFAALTYVATSNQLLSFTVGFGVFLMIGVGYRVVEDILKIEISRTMMFFSGTEEELKGFAEVRKITAKVRKNFL